MVAVIGISCDCGPKRCQRRPWYCLEVTAGIDMAAVAALVGPASRRIDPGLRRARTCYDHLAGELGVAIADALVARGAVDFSSDVATVTEEGRALLSAAAIPLEQPGRRPYCRPCLDWSERRPHLAGVLGAALLDRALKTGLVRRRDGSRALTWNGTEDDVLRRLDIG